MASLPISDAGHVAAAIPVLVAAAERVRRSLPPVPPDPAAGHAADFLAMLHGEPPSPAEAAALDAYLITVAEHGMNASTFTARVVASTAAGCLPSVIAALSALDGPLHGGAPGPVLDMLDALAGLSGQADRRAWLHAEIAAGRRLMGFGHRTTAFATRAPTCSSTNCTACTAPPPPHRPRPARPPRSPPSAWPPAAAAAKQRATA